MIRSFCIAAMLLICGAAFGQQGGQSRPGVLVDTPVLRLRPYKYNKPSIAQKPGVPPPYTNVDTARYQYANQFGYVHTLPDGMPLLVPYSETAQNAMPGTQKPAVLMPAEQSAPARRMPNPLQQRKLVIEKPGGSGTGR